MAASSALVGLEQSGSGVGPYLATTRTAGVTRSGIQEDWRGTLGSLIRLEVTRSVGGRFDGQTAPAALLVVFCAVRAGCWQFRASSSFQKCYLLLMQPVA